MMRLVPSPEELPKGSHSLSFYASRPEAARNMASFLKGAHVQGQEAVVFTADDEMLELYREQVVKRVPEMVGAIRKIIGTHTRSTPDGLRPLPEAAEFASAHPEGASMCGDTIPSFLNRRNLSNILVYEDWYESLRPFYHRGLCPYDLAHLPVDRVPEAFSRLAKAHSHAVLSSDPNPGVRFLQLLILPHVENPPKEHLGWLAQAADYGLVQENDHNESFGLTPRGEHFARALMALPAYAQRATEVARKRRVGLPERNGEPVSSRFKPD
jgi:hypothetical protein